MRMCDARSGKKICILFAGVEGRLVPCSVISVSVNVEREGLRVCVDSDAF